MLDLPACDCRHSFTTRLLYTVMPATMYAKKDSSIDALMEGIASDFIRLFNEGISVTVSRPTSFFTCNPQECDLSFTWGLHDQQVRLEASRGECLLPYVELKGIGHGFENASILPLDLAPAEFATYVHLPQLKFNVHYASFAVYLSFLFFSPVQPHVDNYSMHLVNGNNREPWRAGPL